MTASPSRAPARPSLLTLTSSRVATAASVCSNEGRDPPIEWWFALSPARVAFEEKAFDWPKGGDGGPSPAHANRFRRIVRQGAKTLVLIAFDGFDDRGQHPSRDPEW
jgi:hypothetical protein